MRDADQVHAGLNPDPTIEAKPHLDPIKKKTQRFVYWSVGMFLYRINTDVKNALYDKNEKFWKYLSTYNLWGLDPELEKSRIQIQIQI